MLIAGPENEKLESAIPEGTKVNSCTLKGNILYIDLSKEFIKDIKRLNINNYKSNSNIIDFEQEKDVDEILQEGIGKAKGEDFYRKKYKSAIKKEETYVETEEEIKKKVMSAVTDPNRIKKDDLGNPDICMVAYYQYLVPIALGRERSVVLVTGSRKKKD